MSWGDQPQSAQGGETVTVILAAPTDLANRVWYPAVTLDARFRVSGVANDKADLQFKLTYNPEVIIVLGTLFDGPDELVQGLTSMTGAVYLILPAQVGPDIVERCQKVPAVKSVYLGDANFPELLKRAYGDAHALRKQGPGLADPAWRNARDSGAGMIGGLRVTAVWNRCGGSGRTTIAAALGQAIARRRAKTLLVGTGSPDVLPLHLGLKPLPNITSWFSSSTIDSLRASIQQVGDLSVLPGFPDVGQENGILDVLQANRESKLMTDMVWTATNDNYAVILFDAPVQSLAPHVIQASNSMILVARPTLADAWASVEAFRVVTQMASGQHRINPGNILVVLNMRTPGMLTADEWHRSADGAARKMGLQTGFPPVAVTIPFVPEVPLAQDAGRSALDSSDEFARPINKLADFLVGQSVVAATRPESGGVLNLGFMKIKTRK